VSVPHPRVAALLSSPCHKDGTIEIESIWENSEEGRWWGLAFRHPGSVWGLSALALFDMFITIVTHSASAAAATTGDYLSFGFAFIYIFVVCTRMRFVWEKRWSMLEGNKEGPWIIIHLFMMCVVRPVVFIFYLASGPPSLF